MANLTNAAVQRRLSEYFDHIGQVLGRKGRRELFALYAEGILGNGKRKSIEPIAARACADPSRADAEHQRLLHFALDAPWSDRKVRRAAARYALRAMIAKQPVESWIIDHTGLLKQGSHSVGVQRQYISSLGKIANCQIGVGLTVATRSEQVPIDLALYLPESWTENRARRQEARIPADIQFATKRELALQLLQCAVEDDIPRGVVLADQFYGASHEFRARIRDMGLHYAVAVDGQTPVTVLDPPGRLPGQVVSILDLAHRIDSRDGSKPAPSSRFALRRVIPAHDGSPGLGEREPLWLLIEWRDHEVRPASCLLCSVPVPVTENKLVRLIAQQRRTERAYRELKQALGLDHYEGRRFPGWHHHVSVVLCCYAFVIAERARHGVSLITDDAQLAGRSERLTGAPALTARIDPIE